LSQTITQLCLAKDIDHILISPGSRNAPLIIGFTSNPSFKNFSIVDERCAAFFALGMAQQLQKPVALVCTSGSALLNYYPAIAEAYYSDVPLVVLSADRPEKLLEIGDGQTIKQENVYANHILYSANLTEGEAHQVENETLINIALNTAIELSGPVHINIPFSEPLYQTVNDLQIRPQHVPARHREIIPFEKLSKKLHSYAEIWNASRRKIVLVGTLKPNSIETEFIKILSADESVLVLTETTSNLHHGNFIPSIDQLIAPLDAEGFVLLKPEIVLTFGGMVVSKKIKAFLRTHAPKNHWHVDEKKAYDTYFSLSEHFKISPNEFLGAFLPQTKSVSSDYQAYWLKLKQHRLAQHNTYFETIPFSDFQVFYHLIQSFPARINLQLSNSTAIRYSQLFDLDKETHVFCNRGTSGIDGSTSTAIGASYISKRQTVFVTGDLSFFYDSNALWNNYIPNSFRVIVFNNKGGGIFRILPDAKKVEEFETFFETKHELTAAHLCRMFDFEYTEASSEELLKEALRGFYDASERPKLLEIFTPSEINDTVLMDYFKAIR